MIRPRLSPVCLTCALLLPVAGACAAVAPDKSIYSLSQPTPRERLREMSTDRPDVTEGPFTVDAGHAQVEMDLAGLSRNRIDGDRTREWHLVAFNVRLGLLNNFEAGVFVSPYTRVTEEPRGGSGETHSGFGDVTLRAKLNFWGNEGGPSAGGLIVDLKLPTARRGFGNGAAEGGVIFPLAGELPGGWEYGAMTEVDARHREGGATRAVWVNSATAGHDLVPSLSGYVEITSETGDGAHISTLDLGLTWKLNANTQLDAGVNLGLSRAADDAQFFAGVSHRF